MDEIDKAIGGGMCEAGFCSGSAAGGEKQREAATLAVWRHDDGLLGEKHPHAHGEDALAYS